MTPLAATARGALAGLLGTAAFDAFLFARYRREGGQERFRDWESSADLSDWENAPAPAQVGRRLFEGLFQTQIAPSRARLVNNVMHWGYGLFGGLQYGLVAGSLAEPKVRYGIPFGATFWGSGYVVLPAAKLYEPIWKYDRTTLARDLSAHLVYGVATATAMRVLTPSNHQT